MELVDLEAGGVQCGADAVGILDTPSPLGRREANRLKIAMYLAGAEAVLTKAWGEPAAAD